MSDREYSDYHGGKCINLLVDPERSALLKKISTELPSIAINDRQLCDFELLTTGAYSPLAGFMTRSNYESVLDRMKLQDGTIWPMPICLDVSEIVARPLEGGQSVVIRDSEGFCWPSCMLKISGSRTRQKRQSCFTERQIRIILVLLIY